MPTPPPYTWQQQIVDESGNVLGGATPLATSAGSGVANDAVDSGNPIKIGGKVSTSTPAAVSNGDRVDAWFDEFGRLVVALGDPGLGNFANLTSLRDLMVAQRYTILSDSVADGLAAFWTTTNANGGTTTVSGGEGLLQTSTATNGSTQIVSPAPAYYPGQSSWLNSAIRVGDTGTAGNTRRWGAFTVSGTTPQDGFYFELSGTTLNAVVAKSGTPTATAVGSWSRFASAPFTLDTNYHSFEIRWTANAAQFYVDNIVRHVVSGTTTPITSTLNFPIALQNIKTSGATNLTLAVRNIGLGRFGTPDAQVSGTTVLATGTMTRPADTTAYAAGDGVTTATSSASAMSVTSAARIVAGSGIIFGGVLEKSTTSTTNASFRGWIYQDTPSAIPNDNAAFTAAVHADYQKLVGTFTCDFSVTGVVGSDGVRAPITLERTNMAYKFVSGTAFTVILEARGAYTPGNAEVFRLALDTAQD